MTMKQSPEKITNIKTAIPGPKAKALLKRWHAVEADCTGYQAQTVWDSGRGAVVTDVDGNVFIDWTSGVLVANVGHTHPHLVEKTKQALDKIINTYECPTEYRVRAAEALVKALPEHMDKCFFLTTGSETTEAAIRIMKRKTGNYEIIGFYGGFHGRTYAAAGAGGLTGPKRKYGPSMPGVIRVPYPYCYRCPFKADPKSCSMLCLEYLDDTVRANSTGSLAGLIVEPYLGAAGFIFPPEGWLKKLEQWVRDNEILFTLDEVQSSYGRTGKMWAMEHEDLKPDLVCIGKGIGSGIPASAIGARSDIIGVLSKGEMSSTLGGNPVSSAAVIAVLEIMEKEKLVENANKIGAIFEKRLNEIKEKCQVLGDVRGMGLVYGLELVKNKKTKEPAPDLTRKCMDLAAEHGVLIGSVGIFGNVIRVAPPLVIGEIQAHESLDIMESVLMKL